MTQTDFGTANITEQYMVDLTALGFLPVTCNFSLYGIIGIGYLHVKTQFVVQTAIGGHTDRLHTLPLVYGVGAQYDFCQKRFSARLDYTGYIVSEQTSFTHEIPNVIAVQFIYNFRH